MKSRSWALSPLCIIPGILFLNGPLTSTAQASCGVESCAVEPITAFVTQKGDMQWSYVMEYVDMNQPRVHTRRAAVGQISGHHDEQRTINRVHRVTGLWAATNRLSLEISLPYVTRDHRHIHNHRGGLEIIPEGWDLNGIGDLAFVARYNVFKSAAQRQSLAVIGGAEFPTGKSVVRNADGDEAEPGITPGSNSYDGLLGLSAVRFTDMKTLTGLFVQSPVFASALYKINGKGRDDYRIGNHFVFNVGAVYPVASRLGFSAQANVVVRERDSRGITREETGKTGGEYVYLSPGIVFTIGRGWECHTLIQLPVYQRVNQIQLTSDYNLQTGLSYRFRIPEKAGA